MDESPHRIAPPRRVKQPARISQDTPDCQKEKSFMQRIAGRQLQRLGAFEQKRLFWAALWVMSELVPVCIDRWEREAMKDRRSTSCVQKERIHWGSSFPDQKQLDRRCPLNSAP